MTEIKPIETFYNGYRFRSRLEARWAVFFDALGVKYEYEPEGFDLGDGIYYLPDFRVQCYGTRGNCGNNPFDLYIEVKGKMRPEDEEKIVRFGKKTWYNQELMKMESSGYSLLVVCDIPSPDDYDAYAEDLHSYTPIDGTDIYPWNYERIDGDHFAAYPAVYRGCFYLDGDDSNYQTMDLHVIRKAFKAARQARFEHGETPRK